MSKSNFTLGILTGALVGSAIALLYAPDKGSNTRDVISYRLSNYMDELSVLIEKLTDEKKTISDAKKKGDLVVEDARQRAEDLIKEAEDLLGSIEETKKGKTNGEKS
jgi:gas vesicle protein